MDIGNLLRKFTNNEELTLKERAHFEEAVIPYLTGKSITDLQLDNILVQQKDAIHALKYKDHKAAAKALEIVRPLWEAFGYSYKYDEIKQQLKNYKESLE
jgi:hypothetical protein